MASILEGDSLDLQTADGDDAFASWPAPLVLPGDDLALDPYYPPQSLQQWQHEEHRNEVTSRKNVIYVAACPEPKPEVDFMRKWTQPQQQPLGDRQQSVKPPQAQDVIEYVAAFYHGLSVKLLPSRLSFTKWDDSDPEHGIEFEAPDYVGLRTATECVRIRARTSVDGLFHQLNLDDLLDAAIAILPSDAYALLLLVDHDIYENDDDDFACGRAYGGSRVAVVSSARYNPVLDDREDLQCLCVESIQTVRKEAKDKQIKPRPIRRFFVLDLLKRSPTYAGRRLCAQSHGPRRDSLINHDSV
ncbi:MAG: hypothetical protein M1833_003048 [Piccolia ochrophora]|nr:MAG: hypothetical protein M1833_003048 [Piccolia ochrophora]